MHLIDQELSGLNQLGAIVGAISSYLCGKQFRQLCLTVDWQIIYGENALQLWDMPAVHENEEKKPHPALCIWCYIYTYDHPGNTKFVL